VLVRFGLQTAVTVALSAFGSIDFNKTFAALMWTAIVFCITVAVRAGEPAFGGTLITGTRRPPTPLCSLSLWKMFSRSR
jgi:hypothetical protein